MITRLIMVTISYCYDVQQKLIGYCVSIIFQPKIKNTDIRISTSVESYSCRHFMYTKVSRKGRQSFGSFSIKVMSHAPESVRTLQFRPSLNWPSEGTISTVVIKSFQICCLQNTAGLGLLKSKQRGKVSILFFQSCFGSYWNTLPICLWNPKWAHLFLVRLKKSSVTLFKTSNLISKEKLNNIYAPVYKCLLFY